MNTSENHLNKCLYKLFLILVKYTPMLLAIIHTLGILFNFIGVELNIMYYLGGISIPFLALLFIISYVFKFCYLYRIPLWYLIVTFTISAVDGFIRIPVDTINMFRIYAIVFGLFIITFVCYMYKNRNKPKIDHFKQLCENYSNCC
jgi:hypothetical protein